MPLTQQQFIDLSYTIWYAKQEDAWRTVGSVGSVHYIAAGDRELLIQYIQANPSDPHTLQYSYAAGVLKMYLQGLQATKPTIPAKPLRSVQRIPATIILPI